MWDAPSSSRYKGLIEDSACDSVVLRQMGLVPNVVELVGESSDATVLDAGTGTGWLFDEIECRRAVACDLVPPPTALPPDVLFSQQDVTDLAFRDGVFDVIVSSLVLIYCEDLARACSEFARVAKESGRLVVVLTHPYFYRTGEALPDGRYLLQRDLSMPHEFTFYINEAVGPFTYYYRPFPDYLNALVGAGWEIRHVRDWFIPWADYDAETTAHRAASGLRRTGRVPMFTFVECRKS